MVKKKTVSTKKLRKPKSKKRKMTKLKKKVLSIPKDAHTITSYLIVNNAKGAIDFYKKAFSAKVTTQLEHSGKIMHAELKIGNTVIMLADTCPEMNARDPKSYGGSPVTFYLYVKKVDETVPKAIAVGGRLIEPIQNMFWGDRAGKVEDPYGHLWYIATHIEDVKPKEVRKRAEAIFGSSAKK